jgi:hypothetical protein
MKKLIYLLAAILIYSSCKKEVSQPQQYMYKLILMNNYYIYSQGNSTVKETKNSSFFYNGKPIQSSIELINGINYDCYYIYDTIHYKSNPFFGFVKTKELEATFNKFDQIIKLDSVTFASFEIIKPGTYYITPVIDRKYYGTSGFQFTDTATKYN